MLQEPGDRLVSSLLTPKEVNKTDRDNEGGWSLPPLPNQVPTNFHIHTKVDRQRA